MSQVPLDLSITIPCSVVDQLPAQGGILLATAPPQGTGAALEAMFVRVSDASVDVLDRNVVVATAARDQMAQCSQIVVTSDIDRTFAQFEGLTTTTGQPVQGELTGDLRPQVVGVFTDLEGAVPPGLSFTMNVDSRFSSSPTLIKLVAMIGAALCTLIALGALARLDGTDGRGHRRFLPRNWLRPTAVDVVVVGILLLWHFIGANTSDDGYLLTMARVAEHAGYMANYFRWYGVPEAPFGWYYDVLEVFAKVSTASPWMRLPALLAGDPVLAGDQPRGGAATGPRGAQQPDRAVDRRPGVPRVLAAVQQRAAFGADRRRRRPADLVLDRAGDRDRTAAARGHRMPDRCVHPRRRAHRPDVRGRVDRRHPPAHPDRGAPAPRGRHAATAGADRGGGAARTRRRVRGPDVRRHPGGQPGPPADRPEPRLVRRFPALLLPVRRDRRRVGGASVRVPDDAAVPVHGPVGDVAAQADPGCRERSDVAADGHRVRHDPVHDVQPDEVDPPLRRLRGHRGVAGGSDRCRGVGERVALAAEPDDLPDRAAVRAGAVVFGHQRLLVRLRATECRGSTSRCR